jgi:hypothetical protein
MKKYIFALWLVFASAVFAFSGPPCIPPIPESGIPIYVTIDLTGITDGNVPYMQAAGAGLGDSPMWSDGSAIAIGTTVPTANNLDLTTLNGNAELYLVSYKNDSTRYPIMRFRKSHSNTLADVQTVNAEYL